MADYRLYCLAQSGNSYEVALMLEFCGANWEPIFVDYYGGAHKSREFLSINEMGEVSVLDHGALRLKQSGVILDYLASEFRRYGPVDEAARREILRWLLWDNHKLSSYTGTLRFLIRFATEAERNPGAAELLGARARRAMGVLDRHLAERNWIVGEAMSIADISCVGYMFYRDEVPIDWDRDFPNLVRWRERIRAGDTPTILCQDIRSPADERTTTRQ